VNRLADVRERGDAPHQGQHRQGPGRASSTPDGPRAQGSNPWEKGEEARCGSTEVSISPDGTPGSWELTPIGATRRASPTLRFLAAPVAAAISLTLGRLSP
jgi:hypothetical protein